MSFLVLLDGKIRMSSTDLDRCAEAMYRIREPKGSQCLPFASISAGKKEANREATVRILTAAFKTFDEANESHDRDQLFWLVGDELYRMQAPIKSQSQPLAERSEYAQSWYRDNARRYLWDVLSPYAAEIKALDQPIEELTTAIKGSAIENGALPNAFRPELQDGQRTPSALPTSTLSSSASVLSTPIDLGISDAEQRKAKGLPAKVESTANDSPRDQGRGVVVTKVTPPQSGSKTTSGKPNSVIITFLALIVVLLLAILIAMIL